MDWNEYLRDAVAADEAEHARHALTQGANINAADRDGCTLLFRAVQAGHLERVSLLLNLGARVAANDGGDSSSLHAAVEDVYRPMLALLLTAAGATEAFKSFDYVSRTPLIIAVEQNNRDMAQMLLEAGADVNAHDEARIGSTALHIAAANGTPEMVQLLLQYGADPNIPGGMGLTARDQAEGRKRPDGIRVQELLEHPPRRPRKS